MNDRAPEDYLLPYRPVSTLSQLEAMRAVAESTVHSIDANDMERRAWEQGLLAGILFVLGDGPNALDHAQGAVTAAQIARAESLEGYLLNIVASIRCYMGTYSTAQQAFNAAEKIFVRTGDAFGLAWKHHLHAREYLRDTGDHGSANAELDRALPILRSRGRPAAMIENLLARADCLIEFGDARNAREVTNQVEGLIAENKSFWYRPELFLLRARVAVLENNYKHAWNYCYTGLGMIGDYGDLRLLPNLYLTLASALERDRARVDDARDALERAVASGRTRARRLHLALALRQMGQHLKRYSVRPTVRARGSGFLFEASQMLREMNLEKVYDTPVVS